MCDLTQERSVADWSFGSFHLHIFLLQPTLQQLLQHLEVTAAVTSLVCGYSGVSGGMVSDTASCLRPGPRAKPDHGKHRLGR